MNNSGYLSYYDVDCVYFRDDASLYIIPKDDNEIQKLSPYFYDTSFNLTYANGFFENYAYVRDSLYEDGRIKLNLEYVFENCVNGSFCRMEMVGDAIDAFFNPAYYFYNNKRKSIDYIYDCEKVDSWTVLYHGKNIEITLLYGEILKQGVGSDLMLHPKLIIDFEMTSDIGEVYSIYQVIVRFLKIVNYDANCGNLRVNLYGIEDKILYRKGHLCDYSGVQKALTSVTYNVTYPKFKPYIGKLLQFAANNEEYSFSHFPNKGFRYRGIHYSETDYVNIFSAFESECRANPDLYDKPDCSRIQKIKTKILEHIASCSDSELSDEEKEFLDSAEKRISQLGTQFGQKKKIQQAYFVLSAALDDSIESIFFKSNIKGRLKEEEIREISKYLAEKRGKIAHGTPVDNFSDDEVQYIKFLEILTYSMLLKRAEIGDSDIEKIVGAVFGVNYKIDEE